MYFLLDSKLFVFLLALVNLRLAAVHGLVCPGGECKELPDEETCETLASQKSYVSPPISMWTFDLNSSH